MSHEVETMAWANKVPWHGLGNEIRPDADLDEWMETAGLNWELIACPTFIQMPDGTMIEDKARKNWVRSTDNRIMVRGAGANWRPFQNKEAIGMMREWVRAGGVTMETMGSLRHGQVVWGLARLNASYTVGRSDHVKGYLLITTSHVVGRANTCRTTGIRVLCANTMAMAESEGTVNYRQNHLSDFDVDKAKQQVEAAHEHLAAAGRRANIIAKLKIDTKDSVEQVLKPIFAPREALDPNWESDPTTLPRSIQGILDSVNAAPGAVPGTGWGLLNGVTHYCDHVQGYHTATRMFRSWMGDYAAKKVQVEEKLVEMAS